MKTVVVLSGGLDSTVLLCSRLNLGEQCTAVSFDYGQRHRKELDAAVSICDLLSVPHKIVNLSSLKELLPSACTGVGEIPEGHYEEESMKQTVVPNRNMIMLSVAAGFAVGIKAELLAFGAHGGDHAIYPDCREEFAHALAAAIRRGNYDGPELIAPFISIKKHQIVERGAELTDPEVPFALTWSCYKGGEKHCGKCGTCVERKEAFKLADVFDPTEYEA